MEGCQKGGANEYAGACCVIDGVRNEGIEDKVENRYSRTFTINLNQLDKKVLQTKHWKTLSRVECYHRKH